MKFGDLIKIRNNSPKNIQNRKAKYLVIKELLIRVPIYFEFYSKILVESLKL